MIEDLRNILDKVSDPADLATVLIAGTAGFLIDAGLNAIGFLEPGVVGITAASGALGLKKAVESSLNSRRAQKGQERKPQDEKERAAKLLALLKDRDYELAQRLHEETELLERGIIGVDDFQATVGEIIKSYRERSQRKSGGGPAR